MIHLSAEPIEPALLMEAFTRDAAGAGAIVAFTGLVRGNDGNERIDELWLDHHERMTEQAVAEIAAAACDRFAIDAIKIVHRIGSVRPDEPIVFVAAAARHRRAAFDAVDYAMDRLKTDAPFWKRETRESGVEWIEARDKDHRDRARWKEHEQ